MTSSALPLGRSKGGRKGGKATLKKLGRDHFARIGRMGGKARKGVSPKPDLYRKAVEDEAVYMKRVYNLETRSSMTLGTDSTGGYLAPTLFSNMLYEAIARTSLVRKYATIIPMNGNEIINFPTMSDDGSVLQYTYRIGSQEQTFDPMDIVHFKLPDPANFYSGHSPVQSIRYAIDTHKKSDVMNTKKLDNYAVPPAAIVPSPSRTCADGPMVPVRKKAGGNS